MDNNDSRWPVAIGTTESGEGRVSDRKDSKLLLKSEAAFWELNSSGEMFLYDKGVISHCSLSGVFHQ